MSLAYVFGSHAKGKATLRSDVDVDIYAHGDVGWRELIRLTHKLEDKLGRRVDLVLLNEATPLLAYEVISRGVPVICRNPAEKVEYEVKTLKEFLDVRQKLTRYHEEPGGK